MALRIGAISYTNTLPLFEGISQGAVTCEGQITWAVPSVLNSLMRSGALDIGLISTSELLHHHDLYESVGDYGIACDGPVLSVKLYHRGPIESLDGKVLAVTPQSGTSAELLQVLCRYYWGIEIQIEPLLCAEEIPLYPGVVLIGDQCLQRPLIAGTESVDLGKIWAEKTGLPFTFGIVAARKDIIKERPSAIESFLTALQQSLSWSHTHKDIIIQIAKNRCGRNEQDLENYYNNLQYRLTNRHYQGIAFFQQLANTLLQQPSFCL